MYPTPIQAPIGATLRPYGHGVSPLSGLGALWGGPYLAAASYKSIGPAGLNGVFT